jgi:hypothetical protein
MRFPIFIIGQPRSGTSFVRKLIRKSTGFPGHGESHTIPLLYALCQNINLPLSIAGSKGNQLVKHLDLEALKDINIAFFREFYLHYYGSEQFIDKTPGHVNSNSWELIKDIFPNAVFIACVRSPVEVLESMALKFGGKVDNEGNLKIYSGEFAENWVKTMKGIERLAASTYAADLHVVSQLELRVDPSTTVTKLFQFLRIPESKILESVKLCNESREYVLTDAINKPAYKKISELKITPAEAEQFRSICEPVCSRWGIDI